MISIINIRNKRILNIVSERIIFTNISIFFKFRTDLNNIIISLFPHFNYHRSGGYLACRIGIFGFHIEFIENKYLDD